MRITEHSEINYISVELEEDEYPDNYSSNYVRLSIPMNLEKHKQILEMGYIWVDRTIEAKVPIAKPKVDFRKFIRMQVDISNCNKEDIRSIAHKSFDNDYRFQITFSEHQQKIANQIIDAWVNEQEDVFVCRYKETIVGFADVRFPEIYTDMPFVHLAAVEEKYRASGAAMSLYAAVFEHYREVGKKFAYGRFSSKNMAVMNLYASFGAQFSKPYDIYIKK